MLMLPIYPLLHKLSVACRMVRTDRLRLHLPEAEAVASGGAGDCVFPRRSKRQNKRLPPLAGTRSGPQPAAVMMASTTQDARPSREDPAREGTRTSQ